jgi:hypothetical protein
VRMHINLSILAATLFPGFALAADQGPDERGARQAIERKLMAAKPPDATERNVVLQEVVAGATNGGMYPYQVTMVVRDYSPGFPLNRYYGQTCISRVPRPGWTFNIVRNNFGEWQADGRTTLQSGEGRECTPNPSEGVSSVPLAGLQ